MCLRGRGAGTILGALLFLSCINDLPNCLSNYEPRMFAGDIHLTYADNDVSNKLIKTKFVFIRSGPRLNTLTAPPSVTMDGTRVEQVLTKKSLGLTIDDKLNWNCHIKKLTKTIAWKIGAMKRVRHLVPQATFHLIYQALIQPYFDYRSTVEDCNLELTFCSLPH